MNTPMPAVGSVAPDFSGHLHDGSEFSLSDLKGKKVALFFYPEDDTSVCTRQACNLRDNFDDLKRAGVEVVGVSKDSVSSHDSFVQKYGLPFVLVADPDKKILNAYGAWGEKNMYGNIVVGTKRTTFLIDEAGTIVHVFKKPRVDHHSAEILKKFGLGK